MEKLSLKLGRELHSAATEMAAARGLRVESFITEMLDSLAASFRLQKYRAKHAPVPVILPASERDANPDLPVTHKQLTATTIQKLLYCYPTLTVGQLSKRFNIPATTVRRVLATYAAKEHNRPPGWAVGIQSRDRSSEGSEQP